MEKILLSAFACNPYSGSEAGYGWCWSEGLVSEGFEVHCLTREANRDGIEKHTIIDNLHIHYISLPFELERLYSMSQITIYVYYMIWQWMAYRLAKNLHKEFNFKLAHHVTWGSIQQGSFLYKLKIPFIFGPAGGGQQAPVLFKKYFSHHWSVEKKREFVSNLMVHFNPACKSMLKNADSVLVSNRDTFLLAQTAGAKKIFLTLDTAIPKSFFPEGFISRKLISGQLKLLWIGRLLPRKGLLLVLEVMNNLKAYPGITLTVVGDGEMRKPAEDKCAEFQLQDSVSFKGAVPYDQVREFYASHEAFFFTSLRESGGVQLVEAMAFSLPIITLDLHGSGEIVTEQTGIKIPMNEPIKVIADLTKAIIDLSNDPIRYQSMSYCAHQFANEQIWSKKINEVVEKHYRI